MSNRNSFLFWVIFMTLVETIIFTFVYMSIHDNCGNKIVKCYDHNNNEIIGQSCKQNDICLDEVSNFLIYVIAMIVFLLLNIIFFKGMYL